jgi:hypothetical protein
LPWKPSKHSVVGSSIIYDLWTAAGNWVCGTELWFHMHKHIYILIQIFGMNLNKEQNRTWSTTNEH